MFSPTRFAAALFAASLSLGALACNSQVSAGAGGDSDAAGNVVDASSSEGQSDAGPEGCAPGVDGCTCIVPSEGQGCVHTSNGGNYGHQACSGSYQCCDGEWQQGHDSCGACVCVEPTGEVGCSGDGELQCFPEFTGSAVAIPDEVRQEMIGVSWHEGLGCPSLDSLRLLRFDHWGFDGLVHQGEMVVAASVADDVLSAFRTMHEAKFPIERVERVDAYGGDDDTSMAANNTSAFNCRRVTGGTSLSQHSFGTAIDLNPVQNPYVKNGTVLPPSGTAFTNRGNVRQGMVVSGSAALKGFQDIGWGWGGTWTGLKDYQHFSQNGK